MVQLDPHGEHVGSENEHEGSDGADSMWEHLYQQNPHDTPCVVPLQANEG